VSRSSPPPTRGGTGTPRRPLRPGARARWIAATALVVVVGIAVAISVRMAREPEIPGPLGGPQVAVDVNTMLGRKGQGFTLRDGDGRAYSVEPGTTGRPLVVISHMGFF
jgi:hypothetical protein